jgi:hypothetical protein
MDHIALIHLRTYIPIYLQALYHQLVALLNPVSVVLFNQDVRMVQVSANRNMVMYLLFPFQRGLRIHTTTSTISIPCQLYRMGGIQQCRPFK